MLEKAADEDFDFTMIPSTANTATDKTSTMEIMENCLTMLQDIKVDFFI
jgi:hypothetical protein